MNSDSDSEDNTGGNNGEGNAPHKNANFDKIAAMKLAMNWWRSEKQSSRDHLRRVSNLKDAHAIMRYWLFVVASPEQLKQVGAI